MPPVSFVPPAVGAERTAATSSGGGVHAATVLLFGGLICSVLLLVIASWAPVSPARWTVAGRAAIEHREDFVVAGIALFLITVFLWLIAR